MSNETAHCHPGEYIKAEVIPKGLSVKKAAELLGIHRSDLFPLMTKYQVSVIDLTPEELREELNKPLP